MENTFKGFVPPVDDYFRMPNEWINICATIDNLAELKIVQYVLRHTWGYREYSGVRKITIDEFMHGRKRKDQTRIDNGTGLSKQSVVTGVEKAIEHGFLQCATDDKDLARRKKYYQLNMQKSDVKDLDISDVKVLDIDTKSDVKDLDPDVKDLDNRGLEFRHRSEKDTIERHLKKDIEDTSVSADAERTHTSSDYPIATLAHDTTNEEAEQGDTHGISHPLRDDLSRPYHPGFSDDFNADRSASQTTHRPLRATPDHLTIPRSDTHQEIGDAAYDAFFAPFPPEILTHPGRDANADKPVQDTEKTGKSRTHKPKDESMIKRIDAVFNCLDALEQERISEPDFKWSRTRTAKDAIKTLLDSWHGLSREQVQSVYWSMINSPPSSDGFVWSEHMSVKAYCNNFPAEFAKMKTKAKNGHTRTGNQTDTASGAVRHGTVSGKQRLEVPEEWREAMGG